jgi:hypothetical protein
MSNASGGSIPNFQNQLGNAGTYQYNQAIVQANAVTGGGNNNFGGNNSNPNSSNSANNNSGGNDNSGGNNNNNGKNIDGEKSGSSTQRYLSYSNDGDDDDQPNRYKDQQKKLAEGSLFGTSLNEIQRIVSEGEIDFKLHIKKSIAREYFTFGDSLIGILIGFSVGCFIANMIYEFGIIGTDPFGGEPPQAGNLFFFGILFMIGFFSAFITRPYTQRLKKCAKREGVDKRKIGTVCISTAECTKLPIKLWKKRLCVRPRLGTITWMFRNLALIGFFIIGLSFIVIGASLQTAAINNRSIITAISCGLFIGTISMFVFS